MENNVEREIQKEIAAYNSLPVTFDDFVDHPELSDGVIFLTCTLTKLTTPRNPELQKVPGYYFNICTCGDGLTIGDINLRVGYNEELYYSGNTGYHVYEQHRGNGYAVRACRLLIPVLKAHAMTNIMITNAHDNVASMRVCEKLGAKFMRTARVPEWHLLFTDHGRIYQNIYDWDIT